MIAPELGFLLRFISIMCLKRRYLNKGELYLVWRNGTTKGTERKEEETEVVYWELNIPNNEIVKSE